MKDRHIGIAQIIASGVCFGFLGVFGKYLYENHVKPGELLALRFSFASLLGFALVLFRKPQTLRLSWQQILGCLLLGSCGYALFSFCFFTALTGLSASLTVLLLYTYPVFVAIGGLLFFQEKIPAQHLLAFPVAGLGLIGLVWGDFSVDRAEALLFAMGSSIFYALYILASSRILRRVDPLASTPFIQFFAALTLGSLYLRDTDHSFQLIAQNWPLILLLAFICTVLAMMLFLAGLQKLRSWEVSIISTTEPLTGVLLAILLLGERLRLPQTLGAIAVLAALVWISRPVREDPGLSERASEP